jgi:hypothetical protein
MTRRFVVESDPDRNLWQRISLYGATSLEKQINLVLALGSEIVLLCAVLGSIIGRNFFTEVEESFFQHYVLFLLSAGVIGLGYPLFSTLLQYSRSRYNTKAEFQAESIVATMAIGIIAILVLTRPDLPVSYYVVFSLVALQTVAQFILRPLSVALQSVIAVIVVLVLIFLVPVVAVMHAGFGVSAAALTLPFVLAVITVEVWVWWLLVRVPPAKLPLAFIKSAITSLVIGTFFLIGFLIYAFGAGGLNNL